MSWTDRRVDELKARWADGDSAAVIARHLGAGITRNAVIGKAYRLRALGELTGRGNPGTAARLIPDPIKKGCQSPPDSVSGPTVKGPFAMPATNVLVPSKTEIVLLRAMADLQRLRRGAEYRMAQAYRRANINPERGPEFLNRLIGKRLVRKDAPARYLLTEAAVAYLPKERRPG